MAPDFERLAPDAVAEGLLSILRYKALQFGLGSVMF